MIVELVSDRLWELVELLDRRCHLPFTNWHHFVNDYLHSYLMVIKSQLVFAFMGICQLLMALLLPDDTFLHLEISLINQKETSLLWDRCCHQTVWLHLIVPNYMLIEERLSTYLSPT